MKKVIRNSFVLLMAVCMLALASCGPTGSSTSSGAKDTAQGSAASGQAAQDGSGTTASGTAASGAAVSGASSGATASGATKSGTVTPSSQNSSKVSVPPKDEKPYPMDLHGKTVTYAANWLQETDKINRAADAYMQKKYNFRIGWKYMQTASDGNTLIASIQSHKPIAQYFCANPSYGLSMIKQKLVKPLNQLPVNLKNKVFLQYVSQYYTFRGNTYAVDGDFPSVRNVLMYNKTLTGASNDLYTLQKNGQLNWAKLLSIAQGISNQGKSNGIYGICGSMGAPDLMTPMVAANGGKMISRSGDTFKWSYDSANTKNALQAFQRDWCSGVQPNTAGKNWTWPYQQFAAGKIGILVAWNWQFPRIFSSLTFDASKVGIALFPAGPDNPKAGPLIDQSDCEGIMIPAYYASDPDVTQANVANLVYARAYFKYNDTQDGGGVNAWRTTYGDWGCNSTALDALQGYMDQVQKGNLYIDYQYFYDDNANGFHVWDAQGKLMSQTWTPSEYVAAVKVIPALQNTISDFSNLS